MSEFLEHIPVRAAVASPDGNVLPGYSFEDSTIPVNLETAYTPVRWKTKPDVSELQGREVSLQFEIQGAALYSFRFLEPA